MAIAVMGDGKLFLNAQGAGRNKAALLPKAKGRRTAREV